MVRTKADASVKVSVKASRKTSVLSPGSLPGSPRTGRSDKYAGGNPYCPRPTPQWQKPITNFFGSSGSSQVPEVRSETKADIHSNPTAEDSTNTMSYRMSTYSKYEPSSATKHEYLKQSNAQTQNGHSDSLYYRGDMLTLRQTPSGSRQDGHSAEGNKHFDTLEDIMQKEQETLLDSSPTQITPWWKSGGTQSDKLNSKTITPAADFDEVPPVDRLNIVFLILVLHGIGILTPWNMFITAESYFVHKLNANTTDNSTEVYRNNFVSYLGVAAQVPNIICNALNIFIQFGEGSVTFRIIGSIVVEIVIFILTVILAMLDSSTWPGTFFYITMASVVVINMVNGIYQNSLYGLAAKLPMKYSMAIILGNNTSGTFTSLILILSTAATPDPDTAAVYYFITALFILLACIDTYFALPLARFYRYYDRQTQKAITNIRKGSSSSPSYCKVFRKIWPQCFNVWFVFFVTLTIFPAILANIKPVDPKFITPSKYFTPITCFLVFNFFAMVGSLIPNWIKWPGPKYLWIPVSLRVLMIPYFMMCNYYVHDKRDLPVIINSDWAYVGMGVTLGLTNGYYSSLAMMYAPKCVDTEHAPIAGMISGFFLVLGIVCGLNFAFFVSWITENRLFGLL